MQLAKYGDSFNDQNRAVFWNFEYSSTNGGGRLIDQKMVLSAKCTLFRGFEAQGSIVHPICLEVFQVYVTDTH